MECNYTVKCQEIYKDLKAGRVARCDRCIRHIRQAKPAGIKRARSSNRIPKSKKNRQDYEDSTDDEDYDIAVAGVMKVSSFTLGTGVTQWRNSRILLFLGKISRKNSMNVSSIMIANL